VLHREAQYERITAQLEALIAGVSPSLVAAMATVCAVVHAKMPHHLWTGFYFVAGVDELHVGPYQGPIACQVLKGRGVCLHVARTGDPAVVGDVSAFPGHIACDPRAKSEVVIPLKKGGRVVAVLDIDARELDQFGPADVAHLERIVALLEPLLDKV